MAPIIHYSCEMVGWIRAHPAFSVAVFLFALLAPFGYRQTPTYDGLRMKVVAISLVKHQTPIVYQSDDHQMNTPYSSYGIGMSLVFAPLYAIGRTAGEGVSFMGLAGPILFAATAGVTIETLRRRDYRTKVVALAATFTVILSPLLAYAVTDFSEPGVALMVALIVLALDGVSREARWAALGAGAAVGGAVLCRSDSLLVIAVPTGVALLVYSHAKRRDALLFGVAIVPALVIWGAYNAARYGSIFDSGYHGQPFDHPFWSGLYGLVLSPGRGIVVYVPILFVAAAVTPRLRGLERSSAFFAWALLSGRLLLYARWWSWYGGDVWGPRFLLPVLPAFAPVVAAALVQWPRVTRFVGELGVALALIGLYLVLHPEYNPYFPPHIDVSAGPFVTQSIAPAYAHAADAAMFDWGRFPLR